MASRWGGDETKSQGILGCAVAGLILLLALWFGYRGYPAISIRHQFQKEVSSIVSGSLRPVRVEIENKLIAEAKNLGYDLLREDIDLTIDAKQSSAPKVTVKIPFRYEVDLIIWKGELPLPPIYEEATLIEF